MQVLQDYVELVLLKDVAERHRIGNLPALRSLVRALFAANAGPFSISRLYGALVSQGVRVGKPTLLSYLEHLQDAYLVFLVSIRSRSEKQRMVNPRKVYAVDTGLAAAMRMAGARNRGALLENFVYLELRRRLGRLAQEAICYYRTRSGREVDFIVDSPKTVGTCDLISACVTLQDAKTMEREFRALTEAMGETGVKHSTLITLADRKQIKTDQGVIRIVPAWEWALSPSKNRSADS